jgi:hypothetical protein
LRKCSCFQKYPSFLLTTYLLYSSAELLARRDQESVAESLHPATISGDNILSDANVSLSSGIGTNIAAISSDHAQQNCRLCTGMPLDPENDWCLDPENLPKGNK